METTAEHTAAPGGPTILIYEVCRETAVNLRAALCDQGFRVWTCRTSRQLQESLARRRWPLVLIDFPHPVGRGVDICTRIRGRFDGPVVLVSAALDEASQLRILDAGIDMVAAWPAGAELFAARLRALLRAGGRAPAAGPPVTAPFEAGSLQIDPARREVKCGQGRIELTDLEFDLLVLLARNLGSPVSRETIYRELRGFSYDGQDRSMDLRVSRLRRKLASRTGNRDQILTVRGTGYQLAAGAV